MNKRTTYGRSAAALAIAALCAASTASAQLSETATDCRSSVAKSYGKLVKTAIKTVTACHKARDKGDMELTSVDCNDISAADTKGKYAKASAKHAVSVVKACGTDSDALLTAASLTGKEWYVSCPVSCPDVASPMQTMEDVARCQGCQVGAIAGEIGATTLGMPDQGMSTEDKKCRGAISKGYGKLVDAALKNDVACQNAADESGENDYSLCEDAADVKGKVGAAQTKAEESLTSSCVGADIPNLGSCASDLEGLKTCNLAAWGDGEDTAYGYIYEMPPLICPNAIRTTIRGGCSVDGSVPGNCAVGFQTGSTLSVGWKGLGHRVDITDNYTIAGDVVCPGTFGACGECVVQGISYDNLQYEDFARCRDDSSKKCTNPFGSDPVNCGGTFECEYYLGPPLAVSAGGTPTCTLNVIETDITGTADPDNGTSALSVRLNSDVHSGASISRPCPICRNDPTPKDGVRQGICLGGVHDGGLCDVQGFDLSFALTDPAQPTDGVSLDCPPDSGQSIGTLKINLPLTTGTSTKDAVDPCESPAQALSCFCGVCSGDTTISCDSDANCAGVCVGGLSEGNSCVSNVNCPGACDGGSNDGGSCTTNFACTTACVGGTNPGTTCTTDLNCLGSCSGGANNGANCATDATCRGCVGGTNPGTVCSANGDCTGSCSGGADAGQNCATDAQCSDACTGGSNDGTSCTSNGDCTGTCTGGSNSGANCSDSSTCTNACLGGDNDGTACVDDSSCTGGGTCTDVGSCASIGTCTDDGTCGGQGTCTDDGTCGSQGTCTVDGTCGGQGTCTDTGTCNGAGTCSGSLGVCGQGAPAGVPRRPNNCSDGVCNVVLGQTDRGLCIGSDVERYCDGVLMSNGKGLMGCSSNASCAANVSESTNPDEWVCPGNDCGLCSVTQTRSCFLDPIVLTGTPDTENPILVGAFCLPPSGNGSVNAVTGSPGPGVVQTDSFVEKRY